MFGKVFLKGCFSDFLNCRFSEAVSMMSMYLCVYVLVFRYVHVCVYVCDVCVC